MDPTSWRELFAGVLEVIAGPALGACIALIGVSVNQRMQRTTQNRSRHHEEVRNLAADLLSLSETLWRRGWETHQAFSQEVQSEKRGEPRSSAVHLKLVKKRVVAMRKENETHQEALSAQRKLMLTSPVLDKTTADLLDASRLFPPPLERPSEETRSRRAKAEQTFIDVVRKELGTTKTK